MAELTRRRRRTKPIRVGVLALAGFLAGMVAPSGASLALDGGTSVPVSVDTTASPSATTINENLLGVDGPGPLPATSAMEALGMGWVRTDVSFEDSHNYDCATFTWTGTDLDTKLLQIWQEGARPLLIVDYTPSCLVPEQHDGFPPSPYDGYEPPDVGSQPAGTSDQSLWKSAVYQMATSVLAFAEQHGEATAGTAPAFEVWNEPDGTFWFGGLPGYLNLYGDTAPQLEAAATATIPGVPVEVGGPALLFPDPSWIEPLLAYVTANNLPLDFLSWHYYADYPEIGPIYGLPSPLPSVPPGSSVPYWYNPALHAQAYGEQVEMVKAELATYPSLHPALWIDEWNVDAGYDPRQDGPYDAALAAAVLDSVQAAGLDRMAFFDVANSLPDTTGNWGMLYSDFTPKPVYWAFSFWHQLAGQELAVTLPADEAAADPVGRVGAVASESNGKVQVLLYDFVPYDPTGGDGTTDPNIYDHPVQLELAGLSAGSHHYEVQTVDAGTVTTKTPTTTSGSTTGTVDLELYGDSVALVTIEG